MGGPHFEWISKNLSTVLVLAVAVYFGICAAILVIRFAIRHAHKCPHGLFAGESLKRCSDCLALENARIRMLARHRQIALAAEELRLREQERFKACLLSRLDGLLSLTPSEFEDAVAEMFSNLGYRVVQTPYQNDGGKDAIAYRNGKTVLIECKQYRKTSIGRDVYKRQPFG